MNGDHYHFPNIESLFKFTILDYHLVSSSIETDLLDLLSISNITQIENGANTLLKLLLTKNYSILSLAFLNLIEAKIKQIHKRILEIMLISNSNTVSIITNIIIEIYIKLNDDNLFQLPSFSKFINLIFKLPNIISNYFQSSFINHSNYYFTLCESLIINNLITIPLVLNKISQLKYCSYIYDAFKLKQYPTDTIEYFLNGISPQSCLYSSYYLKGLLSTEVETMNEINSILPLYKRILIIANDNSIFDKVEKLIRKNKSLITLILLSINENKALRNKYLESILVLLKDKNRLFIEDVDTYDFYMIIFSIYYIIESNENFDHLNVFDSIMKIILIVSEVSIDINKKGIVMLLMQYLQKKINLFMNTHNSKHIQSDSNVNESNHDGDKSSPLLTQSQIDLLDFEVNTKHLQLYPNYFLYDNKFNSNFNNIILNQKPLTANNQSIIVNKDKKTKTKYKSIKFQKKYGVFDENDNKSKCLLLEINKEEELSEIKQELKLPNTSSKLKINLNTKDNYNDLNKVKPPSYIKDCVIGLNSQYKDRQLLTLQHLPSLIDLQPLDLDFALKDLYSALIHLHNNFDSEGFEELAEQSLVKLAKYSPNQMTLFLCETFFHSTNNCGLKLKFVILNVLDKSVEEISEYNTSNKIPKANQFHIYFLNVIFPLLNYLKKRKLESLIVFGDFDHLLAKFIFLITKMIKCSENHPLIYKALFESYDLFKAVIQISFIKTKTHGLLEALNAYCNVLISFYNESFILIYPEYLAKVKDAVVFLNELLDDKALNEKLHFNILKTMNKYVINIEKFHSSYFDI